MPFGKKGPRLTYRKKKKHCHEHNRLSDCNNAIKNNLMSNEVVDEEQADSSVVDSPNTFFSPSNNHPPKREKKQQFNLKSKISTMSSLQNFCCENKWWVMSTTQVKTSLKDPCANPIGTSAMMLCLLWILVLRKIGWKRKEHWSIINFHGMESTLPWPNADRWLF